MISIKIGDIVKFICGCSGLVTEVRATTILVKTKSIGFTIERVVYEAGIKDLLSIVHEEDILL